MTDGSGNALAINTYDEHGIPASGNLGAFQYTGQVWLPELGMYHYKARMHSPTLGRFMQTDPIGYGDGMNMYAYVGGDPVNGVDPTGLCDEDKAREYGTRAHNDAPPSPCGPPIVVTGVIPGFSDGWTQSFDLRDYCALFGGCDGVIVVTPQPEQGPTEGGAPLEPCSAPLTTTVGSARAVIGTAQNLVDVATLGAAGSGFGEPAAVGLTVLNDVLEVVLLGVNAFDAAYNGDSGSLVAQFSALPVRLLPAGRLFQSGLKAARGSTGLLRNARGQFRSSYLNNPAVVEAGQQGAEKAAGAVAEVVACGER